MSGATWSPDYDSRKPVNIPGASEPALMYVEADKYNALLAKIDALQQERDALLREVGAARKVVDFVRGLGGEVGEFDRDFSRVLNCDHSDDDCLIANVVNDAREAASLVKEYDQHAAASGDGDGDGSQDSVPSQ